MKSDHSVNLLVCFTIAAGILPRNLGTAEPPSKHVIVVVAPGYRAAIEPWLERRRGQGFRVDLIDSVEVFGADEGPAAIEKLCHEIAQRAPRRDADEIGPTGGGELGFVLLVGDAPGRSEKLDATRMIPGAIQVEQARPSAPKRFVSDNVFGLPDERGRARLAVGRWPVRTADEAAEQVQKVIRFETEQQPGPHRGNITFLGTTPNYDPVFDPLLEQLAMGLVNAQVKPQWGLRALYSSPRSPFFPGPSETERQVVRWLEDATPMTLFAGHGYDCGVDSVRYEGKYFRVLDSDVAERINGRQPGTVLWISACSCGDFDLAPPRRGLAEALMMNPRGPAAVVAGSDETSAWVNLLLCIGLSQDVIDDPPETLGEAFLRFKAAAFKPGPAILKNMLMRMEPTERPEFSPADHQFLYNLLGDPTLTLRLPRKATFTADVEERPSHESGRKCFAVTGTLDGWDDGTAWLSFAIERAAMKERVADPASAADAPAREAAYAERFRVANDKQPAVTRVAVHGGRFEATMCVPESLAEKVRWLRLYVSSPPGSNGEWHDAVAAQAVKLVAEERN